MIFKTLRSIVTTIGVVGLVSACATTSAPKSGDALPGIGLGASGPFVMLSWDDDGPLARQLTNRSRVDIVASYRSANGPVVGEPVASARVDRSLGGMQFQMPETLKRLPEGPVCLRLAHNRRAIPLRLPRAGETSDGFYYPEWEALVVSRAESDFLGKRKSAVQRDINRVQSAESGFDAWRSSKGYADAGACDSIMVDVSREKPDTAMTGAEKEMAARKHCVALFGGFSDQVRGYKGQATTGVTAATSLSLATEVRNALPPGHAMAGTASRLIADINRYGRGEQVLAAQSFAIDQASKISLQIADGKVSGVTGAAILETYDDCTVEAEERMQQSYDSWRKGSRQSVQDGRSEPIRQECRERFRVEGERQTKLTRLQGEMVEIDQKIAAQTRVSQSSLPAQSSLIPKACPATLRGT